MPAAKIKASNTPNVMKTENVSDSLDTSIRQAVGREPFLPFTRAADSQVQWMQLLHALDQQDIPGWPLLSPLKVQMQKCEKCPREFCSSINYRRHLRVHHRLKKLDKDSAKNREALGAFWDKLSADDAKEIASFTDATLEEVPGSSLLKTLTSLVRKPAFSPLPPVCLKAGSALLDIVQGRSKFPVSSQEFFSILDDASEKTFLCGMTAAVQKYVFDGEAGKICLEPKNVVACSSFLLEQNLVKAWHADKDAEALRCQKLLVEEEEAAQKRQAELLERKRQKKLRQKEQKLKDQKNAEKADIKESSNVGLVAEPPAETPSPSTPLDSVRQIEDRQIETIPSVFEPTCQSEIDDGANEAQPGLSSGHIHFGIFDNVEEGDVQGNGRQHVVARWQVPPTMQRGVPNGFHVSHAAQGSKHAVMQKHGNQKDHHRPVSVGAGNKVWSRKLKPENNSYNMKTETQTEVRGHMEESKNLAVLIGSIPINLGNSCSLEQCNDFASAKDDDSLEEHQMKKNNVRFKPVKPDAIQSGANRSTVKLWRPVSRNGNKDSVPNQCGDRVPKADKVDGKNNDPAIINQSCVNRGIGNSSRLLEEGVHPGSPQFSVSAAKAFLAQRWKEAVASDHVKLVLYPESERSGCSDIQNDGQAAESLPKDVSHGIPGNAENHSINSGVHETSTTGAYKGKYTKKHDKSVKIKYIPKQRSVT